MYPIWIETMNGCGAEKRWASFKGESLFSDAGSVDALNTLLLWKVPRGKISLLR